MILLISILYGATYLALWILAWREPCVGVTHILWNITCCMSFVIGVLFYLCLIR
jgi:hypothetical protein